METRILFKRDPSFLACPDCGQTRLTKSRSRTTMERFAKQFTFYRTYRCKNCGWRGYVSSYIFRRKSLKSIFAYLLIIIVTLLIVTLVMKRII